MAALLDASSAASSNACTQAAGQFASAASFDGLCKQQPDLAIKLLAALGRELSVRLRYANLTIQQLET